MKPGHIIKIILLALPAVTLIYVFFLRDGVGGGIGGGSYDLTKMYTLVGAGLYLLILNLALLVQNARGNWLFLLAGAVMLTVTFVVAARTF